MKRILPFIFLCLPFFLFTQDDFNCDHLAINVVGVLEMGDSEKIVLEVSNAIYMDNLFNYPGFILRSEGGVVLAKERADYYGIGSGFQLHFLDIKKDITFPFTGFLELHINKYNSDQYCSIPVEIAAIDLVTKDDINEERIRVASNLSNKDLIIDMGSFNLNVEELDYYISISNDLGETVYTAHTDMSVNTMLVEKIGGAGVYYLTVWDNHQKKLLPLEILEI